MNRQGHQGIIQKMGFKSSPGFYSNALCEDSLKLAGQGFRYGGTITVNSINQSPGETITVYSFDGSPGGDLQVKSSEETGTEFEIILPATGSFNSSESYLNNNMIQQEF